MTASRYSERRLTSGITDLVCSDCLEVIERDIYCTGDYQNILAEISPGLSGAEFTQVRLGGTQLTRNE